MRMILTLILGVCISGVSVAQDDGGNNVSSSSAGEQKQSPNEAIERAQKTMTEVKGFTLVDGEQEAIPMVPEALYTYVDPIVKITQATVWAFGTEGRPHAVFCLSTLTNQKRRFLEGHSFSEHKLQFTLFGRSWQPEPAWAPKELVDAGTPYPTAARRLTQLRRLTKRFGGGEYDPGTKQTTKLRVISQPIYRYPQSTPEKDGAVFVMARDADPEAILVIETFTKDNGEIGWQYMFGRMTANVLTLTVDEETYSPERGRGVQDSYFLATRTAEAEEQK